MNDYGEMNEFDLNLDLRIYGLKMNITMFLGLKLKIGNFFYYLISF